MKKQYITLMMSGMMSIGMTSCDKWLNINPEFEIVQETLFERAQGYYAALNGLYMNLSATSLYGQELTWGAIEAWGKGYQINNEYNKGYYWLANFDYNANDVKNIGAGIWLNCFNVIAGANNLIQNLENDQDVVFPDDDITKNLILGEAYAIRALMHFEIVRIFAQAPALDQGGVTAYVPFVDKFPSKVNPPIPTKDVLGRIISDLEKAKESLRAFDTESPNAGWKCYQSENIGDRICLDYQGSTGTASGAGGENFFGSRANRLGYYPITQLLARVYLYAGNNDKAYEHAYEIVSLNNSKICSITNPNYIGNPQDQNQFIVHPRLHTEILFGIYNYGLKDVVKFYFDPMVNNGLQLLQLNTGVWMYLFGEHSQDRRALAIPSNVCTKYSLNGRDASQLVAGQSLVSVLRLPECYYIAAESIFDKDPAKAVEIFNQMVEARGNNAYKLELGVQKNNFMAALVKEYQREFLSEGVMPFVYKRLDYPIYQNGGTFSVNGKMVMPLPSTEAGAY